MPRQTRKPLTSSSAAMGSSDPVVQRPLVLYIPSGSTKLLSLHEIPEWQQDNEYICSGYRPTSGSAWISIASVLNIHNETVNIYSHLVGALIFSLLPLYFYEKLYLLQPNAHIMDMVVVSLYCLGVTVCFVFSATFHILCNHSQGLTLFWNKLDYLGILVLMWGAGIPIIYYGFICNRNLQIVYCSIITSTALCCGIVTLHPCFISPKFRHWRACFYAGFGLSSIVFIVHGLVLYGLKVQTRRMSLKWMAAIAVSNLVGAAAYAARVPERWSPHSFDLFGASHQILHVAVMVAAMLHFCGVLAAFTAIRFEVDACATHSA